MDLIKTKINMSTKDINKKVDELNKIMQNMNNKHRKEIESIERLQKEIWEIDIQEIKYSIESRDQYENSVRTIPRYC